MEPNELDQQVATVLAALQEAGEPITAESVRQRVGRRMMDVLAAMKRVTGAGTREPDVDLAPEDYPAVREAAHRVARSETALQAAEQTLTDRERALAQAEAAAAEAWLDGRDAPSLVDARQQVLAQAEIVHLLTLATGTAKERYAAALATAETRSWEVRWRHFQMAVAVFDSALAEAFEAQQAAMAAWNRCGQPQEPPLMRGPLSLWESDFHAYLMDLVAMPASAVIRGAVLTTGGMPRGY